MTLYAVSALILIFGAALIGLWWTAADLDRQIDFRKSVLTSTPNQFLVCPDGLCKDQPHMTSPTFQVPLTGLAKAWDEMMNGKDGFTRLNENDLPTRRHYEQRTKWMRFPDRITVEFLQIDDATSGLAIYSRSKYGYSDGGVNKARVTGLLQELKAHVP